MATLIMIDSIHRPKSGSSYKYLILKNTIKYILNPLKTEDGLYTESLNCMCASACSDMIRTQKRYGKEPASQKDRIGYHFSISWSPEEKVTPELALKITRQFAEAYLSEHEVVLSAHLDKEHMHTHICFNSVRYTDGKKYRYENGDWEKKMQPMLDELCLANGLRSLEMDTGKTLEEHREERKGNSRKKRALRVSHSNCTYCNEKNQDYSISDYIRHDIDTLIAESSSMEEFEEKMKEVGYSIKHGMSKEYGPYMSVWCAGMKRYRRTHRLDTSKRAESEYSEAMIRARILAKDKPLPEIPLDQNERYLFSKRIYRCRIYYKTQNDYLRRHYTKLYRLGIIPKTRPHMSYREVQEQIKELRRLEYQVNLIADKNIQSSEQLEELLHQQTEQVEQSKKELKSLYEENVPYKKEYATYQKLEEMEGYYLLFEEGNETFQKKAEEYLQIKNQTESFGHSFEELKQLQINFKEKCKIKKSQIKEEEERLAALQGLSNDFTQTQTQYQKATNEMLSKMNSDTKDEPTVKVEKQIEKERRTYARDGDWNGNGDEESSRAANTYTRSSVDR